MLCGDVGWDRKVPSQNAVRMVLMPALPLPCHGTRASPTHTRMHVSVPSCIKGRAGTVTVSGCLLTPSFVHSEEETLLDIYWGLGPEPGAFTYMLSLGGR